MTSATQEKKRPQEALREAARTLKNDQPKKREWLQIVAE
jgi:hypothetical protein